MEPSQVHCPSPGPKRRRRGGSRIYTGCKTCRARKIKCDQRQPACYNCERSRRYICDGYDPSDSASEVGSGSMARRHRPGNGPPETARRPTPLSPSGGSPAPSALPLRDAILGPREIDRLFRDLEAPAFAGISSTGEARFELTAHPFFGWPSWAEWSSRRSDIDEAAIDHLLSGDGATIGQSGVDLLEEYLPSGSCANAYGRAPRRPSPTPTLTMDPDAGQGLQIDPGPPPRTTLSPERPRFLRGLQPTRYGPHSPLPTEVASEPWEAPETTRKLLHHYQTHVCQLMMPTSAPSLNPWLRIYLPLALQKPTTAAKKCLLYAILSVAAFNKAELADGDRAQVQRQASEYKDRAASMLRQCLADLQQRLPNQANDQGDATDSQALLAAGLTMTTVEIFSGATEGKGYEHIQLCKQIVRHTGGLSWWLSDASSATLVQIFRCLDIVAHTSGWRFLQETQQDMFEGDESSAVGIDALSSPSSGNDTPEADPMGPVFALAPKYTLDVTFGVSMKTLACLDRIVALSKAKAGFAAGEGWSTAHVDQLINLEADIFDTLEDPEALGNPSDAAAVGLQEGISSYVSQEIKHNHVWAFHYSSAVFYRRALCDGGATVQPLAPVSATVRERWEQRPSGQALVSKALEYLENVDALSSDIAIANTLWPGFIAAIEASDMPLRHRALIWFTRAKRHGIGNIVKAKDLVMEVWRRVDRQTWVNPTRKNLESELSHTDWRQVMRDTGMYIMLT